MVNYLWINTPPTVYGANSPIALTAVTKCVCFDQLCVALEYSGNTALNPIILRVQWFDQNQVPLYTEDLITGTSAAENNSTIYSVKGSYAQLSLVGSINPLFTASTQAILKNY